MAGYIGPIPVPQATQNRETFTATASQTSFATGGYQAGYLDVFMNGVKLVDGSDYTATNGSDVVLATGAAVNDIIEVVSYSAFEVLNQNFTGTTVVDDLTVGGNLTVTGTTITLDHANAQTVDLGDNDKIRLGDGDDLQLYHDGTHSYISDAGTGPLRIITDGTGILLNKTTTESMGRFLTDGAVELYYDNAKKFETTSFGAQITGSLAVDTITNATANTDVTIDTNFDIILDAGGNVGIGTSSPTVLLDLESASPIIRLTDSDASGTPECQISGAGGDLIFDADRDNEKASSVMSFKVDGSERMRLDSSGNLLVGKTSADLSLTGIQATSSGQAFSVTRDGGAPFNLNRKSSEGEIAGFYKDAVKTGAIGVRSSDLVIYSSASGHEGLRLGNGAIVPTNNTGVSTDNACNLGSAGGRFTDVYLAGGVFLGGTGVANKLHDYEEGSWTPVIGGSSSTSGQSYSQQHGTYTKIGNAVHLHAYVSCTATGTMSGSYATVQGLPFSVANNNGSYAAVNVGYYSGLGISVTSIQGYTNKNGNFAYLTHSPSAQAAISYLTPSQLGTTASLILSITYNTDS